MSPTCPLTVEVPIMPARPSKEQIRRGLSGYWPAEAEGDTTNHRIRRQTQ
jgi:hypothetical protein